MAKEAVFWSACDAETLELESPTEAIHEYLDSMYDPNVDILTAIARCCPLTVTGFAPVDVNEKWVVSLAANAAERFVQVIDEEYGDPWYLDELLALLPAGWTLGHRWDPKFTPYYVARSTGFVKTGFSPVEVVAALVLAVRGAGKEL